MNETKYLNHATYHEAESVRGFSWPEGEKKTFKFPLWAKELERLPYRLE